MRTEWMVLAGLLTAGQAAAHIPTFSVGQFDGPETAYEVTDPDVSIVVYHEVTCEAPVLWMHFELDAPGALYWQLAIPEIEALQDYRPAAAVVARGLSDQTADLPIDVPEGYGVHTVDTLDVETPG